MAAAVWHAWLLSEFWWQNKSCQKRVVLVSGGGGGGGLGTPGSVVSERKTCFMECRGDLTMFFRQTTDFLPAALSYHPLGRKAQHSGPLPPLKCSGPGGDPAVSRGEPHWPSRCLSHHAKWLHDPIEHAKDSRTQYGTLSGKELPSRYCLHVNH